MSRIWLGKCRKAHTQENALLGTPRVVVTCGSFEPGFRGGGPVRSVAQILDTSPRDIDLILFTRDRDLHARRPYEDLSGRWVSRSHARVFYLNVYQPAHWFRLVSELRQRPSVLLYLNSMWDPWFTVIPLIMVSVRLIPVGHVLIAPRGELSAGALAIKARKKRLFLKLWRRVVIRLGVTWSASSALEAGHIRALFPDAYVEIASVNVKRSVPASSSGGKTTWVPSPRRRFVFVSRISQIKNLDVALEAFVSVSQPVTFDIFGPIEDRRYWSKCQAIMSRLPGNVEVSYRGELSPSDVTATFSRYDAFVFLSQGENFGHVIDESLSVGCPVICSDRTSWTAILERGGGEVVREPTAAALRPVLDRWAAMSIDQIVEAHEAAAAAYADWKRKQPSINVIDQTLQRIERSN